MILSDFALPVAFLLLAAITAALAALYFELPGRIDRLMGWFWSIIAGIAVGVAAGIVVIQKVCG